MKFLKRCKNEMKDLYNDCKTDLLINGQKHRRWLSFSSFATTLAYTMMPVLAASPAPLAPTTEGAAAGGGVAQFGSAITSIITEVYNATWGVVTVLAGLLLIIAFVVRMTANQQKASQATSWIVRIVVCYIGINCVGFLFTVIHNTTDPYRDLPTNPMG